MHTTTTTGPKMAAASEAPLMLRTISWQPIPISIGNTKNTNRALTADAIAYKINGTSAATRRR
jgi:hypothetical protein